MGRPTLYKPEHAAQAEKLCRLGATDQDLADFFEVCVRTVHYWQSKHAEFLQSLKIGKETADNRVERSLYHRAVGYSYPDVHVSSYQGEVTLTPITKHYPPDVTACIFWLKNRRPDQWRAKPEPPMNWDDEGWLVNPNPEL